METTEKDPADIEEELLGMEQWRIQGILRCVRSISQGTISSLLSSLKVGDLSNMLNFAQFCQMQ